MTSYSWFFITLKLFAFSSLLVYAETTGNLVQSQSNDEVFDDHPEQIVFDAEAYTHPVTGACVVAVVNEVPIYDVEIDRQVAKTIGSRELSVEERDAYRLKTLRLLIRRQLVMDYLSRTKHIASQQEIDFEVSKATKQFESRGSSLKDFLASGKLDELMFRRSIAWNISWERYSDEYLTDENLKRFYKKKHKEYDGTTREVRQILLGFNPGQADSYDWNENEREMSILLRRIRKGELSFEEAVQKFSTSPTKNDGGKIGWLQRTGPMDARIHAIAFTLNVGEVSSPITSPHGLHLVKVTGERPGDKTWDDVKDRVLQSAKVFLFDYTSQQQQSKVTFTGKILAATLEHEYSDELIDMD
ncbi:MAG: peptidylprolyl isomerase [Pirellulales bacterium]